MNRSEWLALLLAAAAIVFQSFVPPTVGLANNGDFPKITGPFDVGNPSDDKDVMRFADLKYVVDSRYHYDSGFYSSELLFVVAALALNSVFGHPNIFDLRFMGAVHAAFFLFTLYLFLPLARSLPRISRLVVIFFIIFVFTDVVYVSYFNSFYMDTAALLFLLLFATLFLRSVSSRRPVDRWLCVAAAVLLVTSKTQHFALGIPIALLFAWKGGLVTRGRDRLFQTLSAGIILAATVFNPLWGTPRNYSSMAAYSVIFSGLLPHSTNVAADLRELGLDNSYRQYIGTNAYSTNTGLRDPHFEAAFIQGGYVSRIALFFLRHPSRALDAATARMDTAGLQRPYLGNFDRSTGRPEYAKSQSFAMWSGLKTRIFGRHGLRYLIYSLLLTGFVTVLAVARRKSMLPGMPEAIWTLLGLMLIELTVASFGDVLDSERHYLLFSVLTDLLIVCGFCLAASAINATAMRHSADALFKTATARGS